MEDLVCKLELEEENIVFFNYFRDLGNLWFICLEIVLCDLGEKLGYFCLVFVYSFWYSKGMIEVREGCVR